ncbi:MAG TPA: histidine phosphatase family protein [Syntrophales bacterium]|nr:histidine phosphatase family protein [Syntrophales bacterium]HOX94122.1 histidine phosphatase family protein [Syntrophales bacterium]HPI57810.1 histidine phosphatase family protein [Syntrophales bacterium]HPN25524.1 histidine phosphatase family protein [Syntrophales bacterium]HQM28470.1 histidine phosphatase family protein [Syntrophales bacterium]
MRLILIRHGQTDWNRGKKVQGISDISLNEMGVRQAHKLALSLKDERINAIYTSPLKRAYETARIVGHFHEASIHIEHGLMEMNPGDFEGLHFHELRDHYKDFLTQWMIDPAHVRMPHGETLSELQGRAWPVMEYILNKTRNALVVSHNFTIAAVLCKIRDISLSEFRSTCVDVASKTIIDCAGGKFYFERFNDVGHLETLGDSI